MKVLIAFMVVFFATNIFGDEKVEPKSQGTTADRTRLVNDLFKNYNKKVNPDNLTVNFGVALINFDIVEEKSALRSYVWLRYTWNDSRLAWDEKDYNVPLVRLDPKLLWLPDITLYNSIDPVNMMSCWDSNVLLYSNGQVLWVPPCKLLSYCQLSLKKHPYGEQTCSLKFGSWTFDEYTMDLQFYKNNYTTDDPIDLSDMIKGASPYEIVKTSAERHSKFYPCCAEPYPDLTFNLTMKRIPGVELLKRA